MENFEIKYEFMPSKENESRLFQAYSMVFQEIEDMLRSQKKEDGNEERFKHS